MGNTNKREKVERAGLRLVMKMKATGTIVLIMVNDDIQEERYRKGICEYLGTDFYE